MELWLYEIRYKPMDQLSDDPPRQVLNIAAYNEEQAWASFNEVTVNRSVTIIAVRKLCRVHAMAMETKRFF